MKAEFGGRFSCLHCLHCCYFKADVEAPTLFPWEKRRIEETLKKGAMTSHKFEPILIYGSEDGVCVVVLYRWLIKGFCPFFNLREKVCTIHDDKPLACRMYPLLLDITGHKLSISLSCDWIRAKKDVIRTSFNNINKIKEVFPTEFQAALEVLSYIENVKRFIKGAGLIQKSSMAGCRRVYDIDEYMERFDGIWKEENG